MNPLHHNECEGASKPATTAIETVQELPESFQQGGFEFTLRKRIGDVALFEKRNSSHRRETFEVVIVQKHSAKTVFGIPYPAREALPGSESWGHLGWTFNDRSSAESRFALLCERRRKRVVLPRRTSASMFSGAIGVKGAEVDR